MTDSENPKVTLDLICQDEEEMIEQCIGFLLKLANAIAYTTEFVIVDGGSIDKTIDIINDMKDDRFRIFENPWPGFAAQRNFAKSKSRGEWSFMAAADSTSTDSIYEMINGLIDVGDDIAAYSFPKIHLVHDTEHMYDKSRDPIMALYRNMPDLVWGGEGLENPMFNGTRIIQHPKHFNFPWQRYVPEVTMIHFAELKSEEARVRKTMKYAKLANSRWFGRTEEQIRKAIVDARCTVDPTGDVFHAGYKICPVSKYYQDIKFYNRMKEVKG